MGRQSGMGRQSAAPVDALRTDGRVVRIRPVENTDGKALHDLFDRVSDRSIYLRFFSLDRGAAHRFITAMLDAPRDGRRAVVAVVAHEVVGLAGYAILSDTSAEIALLIDDDYHHLGIGTLLLEDLVVLARGDGLTRFVAEVLSENRTVIGLMRDLGYHVDTNRIGSETELVCDLSPDPRADAAMGARQRAATVESLRPILAPRSIAVIGATDRQRSVGLSVLHSLIVSGFRGQIHPINPNHTTVLGRACHPTVGSLSDPPDLAVVAVPAQAVVETVRDCGRAGVRGIVLLSAGFRESGSEGAAREAAVVAVAREYGMRIIGPNCLGVVNSDDAVRLAATLAPLGEVAGSVGLASQSRALGIAVAADAARRGIGVSQFVCLGNKADVSGNDLLDWWAEDPLTRVVGLYLESFGNPQRFRRVAREVTRRKPVIAIKAWRSGERPGEGTSLTTGAAGGDQLMDADELMDALCEQSGVVRVRTLSQFVDGLRLLAAQPLPAGPRVAVLGNFGGSQIVATDTVEREGLRVPVLSSATRSALIEAVPHAAATANPVDLGAEMTVAEFDAALTILLGCADVDAICIVISQIAAITASEVTDVLRKLPRSGKPLAVTVLGAPAPIDSPGVAPMFDYPEAAMGALSTAWQSVRMRNQLREGPVRPDAIQPAQARAVIARAPTDGWLDPADADDLLRAYGVPLAPHTAASTAELLIGALRLRPYGAAVVLGAGGNTTDLVDDRCLRLAPLTSIDLAAMTDRLRCKAIFEGYRGAAAVSRRAVHDVLARVATLVSDFPEIAELELNPVQCDASVVTVVQARIRLATSEPWLLDRALRVPRPAADDPS